MIRFIQSKSYFPLLMAFKKHVIYTCEDGIHDYSCPKNLWGVSCGDQDTAFAEASMYFKQYYEDGEYDVKNND